MRKVLTSLVVGAFAIVLLGGCAIVAPMDGFFYTDLKGPVAVGDSSGASKTGTAKATSIFGFATGDASIETAMQNGGITKIHHVDTKVKSILTVYVTYETVVTGE